MGSEKRCPTCERKRDEVVSHCVTLGPPSACTYEFRCKDPFHTPDTEGAEPFTIECPACEGRADDPECVCDGSGKMVAASKLAEAERERDDYKMRLGEAQASRNASRQRFTEAERREARLREAVEAVRDWAQRNSLDSVLIARLDQALNPKKPE